MRNKPRQLGVAVVILLLAFGLRVWDLGAASLWADEATSAWWANASFDDFISDRVLPRGGNQLPLHIASLRLFPTNNEFLLRFPSVAASVMAIAAFMTLVRHIHRDRSMALVAGLLIATNPLHVWLSRAARPYAYFFAAVVLVSFFFLLIVQGKRTRAVWIGFVVSSALVYLTHYFALFLPVAQYLLFGLYLRRLRGLLRPWLLAQTAAGLGLLILWGAQILYGNPGGIGIAWIPEPGLADIPLTIANLLIGYTRPASWFILVGLLCASAGLVLGIGHTLQTRSIANTFWLLLATVPLIAIFIASKVLHPLYVDRYFAEAQIGVIVLMLIGWWQISRPHRRYFLVTLVIMGGLLSVWQTVLSGEHEREDWRAAVDFMASDTRVGDGFVLEDPYFLIALSHYLQVDRLPFYILSDFDNRHEVSDFPRVWVIYRNPYEDIHRQGAMPAFDPYDPDLSPTGSWLAQYRNQVLQHADFNGISVFLVSLEPET